MVVFDKELDKVTLTNNFPQAKTSSFMRVVRLSYYLHQFEFYPKAKDVGNYNATVTLTDNNPDPKSTTYEIEI